MSTKEGLCNLALGKLGLKDRIASLSAPTLPLERHFFTIYNHYRDVELSRHRWLFAKQEYVLSQGAAVSPYSDKPYSYDLPDELLKPWRDKLTEWVLNGRTLFSGYATTITLTGTRRVPETMFDPLFDEVFATRLALESMDVPGVSDTKRADSKQWYAVAIADAKASNAIQQEAPDISDDANFSWLNDRLI